MNICNNKYLYIEIKWNNVIPNLDLDPPSISYINYIYELSYM